MMWVLLIILKIILFLFLALLMLLITLLLVPFTYKGAAAVMDGISYSFSVGWFWNLFSVRGNNDDELLTTEVYLGRRRLFTVDTNKLSEDRPKKKKMKKEKEEETEQKAKADNSLKSMFDTKLIKEAFEYIKKIISQVKPENLQIKGVYGFEDPSLTGMTAGFIYSLQALLPQSRIQLQPCFVDEVLELEAEAEGSIRGGKIAYDTIRFLLKPDIRKKIFKRSKKLKPKSKN